MVEGNSVIGMQCIQKAIIAVALCMHCRPMVEAHSVIGMQCIQKAIVAVALCTHCRPKVEGDTGLDIATNTVTFATRFCLN